MQLFVPLPTHAESVNKGTILWVKTIWPLRGGAIAWDIYFYLTIYQENTIGGTAGLTLHRPARQPNLTIGGESLALRLWANDNLQDELCHSTWHRALSQHVAPSFATAPGTKSFGFIFADVQKVFFYQCIFHNNSFVS